MNRIRCHWALSNDPQYVAYHDEEWGVPSHDDRHLFELLTLGGAQAGLSWAIVLRKRAGYRRAFAGFDPARIARLDATDVVRLLQDPGIIRNRIKIEAAIANARATLALQAEVGSLAAYVWGFVDGRPLQNAWRAEEEIPAATDCSRALSQDLRRRGFRFVGATICYAFLQAAGLVNDHLVTCFRYPELAQGSA